MHIGNNLQVRGAVMGMTMMVMGMTVMVFASTAAKVDVVGEVAAVVVL